MNQSSLVFLFLAAGAGIMILVFLAVRWLPGWQKKAQQSVNADLSPSKPVSPAIQASKDAVILVQPGGRVVYTNAAAQDWFGAQEQRPNLERLARKTRPADVFLGLCVSEGQARFTLDGRLVEGSSYFVPYSAQSGAVIAQGTTPRDGIFQASMAMLVTLRKPQISPLAPGADGADGSASLEIISQLSQQMTASLDLDKTLLAILESVERLIAADIIEITRWDAASNHLAPYRFVGAEGERRLEASAERYQQRSDGTLPGYSGYLVSQRQLLVVNDVDAMTEVQPAVDRRQYPYKSYLGMPLIVAGSLVGTLELASLRRDAFGAPECEILGLLAGPAAIALQNALLYAAEQRRILEFSGLASLAKAGEAFFASPSRDMNDLYARLVEVISGLANGGDHKHLLDVKVLGFLIFHEQRRQLEAVPPFRGIPQQMLELYKAPIPPDSPAEKIWLEQSHIFSPDAAKDSTLIALGLDRMAVAAGIQQTVLAALVSGGRKIGYLQAADKPDGTPFSEADLRLLEIIAGQAAAILENAQLVQQSQQRAQRSEALRRIASLAASSATLDEILSFSLRELARLLRADTAAILLLDQTLGELRLHRPSFFHPEWAQDADSIRIAVPPAAVHSTVTGSGHALIVNDLISENPATGEPVTPSDKTPLEMYRPIFDALNISSVIVAPLVMRDHNVGELMLGSDTPGFFDRSALTLTATTASQLGSAIERFALYNQTDEGLRRRVVQLLALTRISRELNTTVDLRHVLSLVYDEILKTTLAHCGSIVLLQRPEDRQPGAGSTAGPAPVFSLGEEVASLSPLERQVVDLAEPQLIKDYTLADLPAPHAGVRSGLYVPIGFSGNVTGLISLHAETPGFFDQTALEIVQSLAVQAAIALANAFSHHDQLKRTEQLNRRVETLNGLVETAHNLSASKDLEESLETIAYAVERTTPFGVVLMSVFSPETRLLERKVGVGIPLQTLNELRQKPQPWSAVQTLLQPEFQVGRVFLIPADRAQLIVSQEHLSVAQVLPSLGAPAQPEKNLWLAEDICLAPLYSSTGGEPLGLISVDAPRDGLRPDRATLDTLELFASQAALIIETQQKIQRLETRSGSLQALAAPGQAQALLHKDLEQTLAIHQLTRRGRLVRAALETAEAANKQDSRSAVLLALAKGLLTGMDFDAVLVAELHQGSPRLVHAVGAIPAAINPQALLGQRNPLRTVLQHLQPIFSAQIEEPSMLPGSSEQDLSTKTFRFSPLLAALDAQAFVCFPLPADRAHPERQINTAVMGVSTAALPAFGPEDELMFAQLAGQVGFTLQNLTLVEETNRSLVELNVLLEFSRQLSSQDTVNIVRTLVESARQIIPAADAVMGALWSGMENRLAPQHALGYLDNARLMRITYGAGETVVGRVFASGQPERIAELDFAQQYSMPAEAVLLYRDATGGRLPVSSLVVPITAQDAPGKPAEAAAERHSGVLGVLVLDNFKTPGAFSEADQALVVSLARQAALTLENVRLYQAAEARTAQLQALTKAAEAISSNLQVDELTSSLLNQIQQILPYDTATLWLRGADGSRPPEGASPDLRRGWNTFTVRAAQECTCDGYASRAESLGQSVALADSLLLREMVANGQPVVVQDVRLDTRFPSLVEAQYLSWLSLPLLSHGDVVGVLVLEKLEANYFTGDHVQVMETFVSQASIALENAGLYQDSLRRAQELDQRSRRLALLNRLSSDLSASLDQERIFMAARRELLQAAPAVPGLGVALVLVDEHEQIMVRAEQPPRSAQLPLSLPASPLVERLRESQGVFSTQDVSAESELSPWMDYLAAGGTRSLLALPFIAGADLLGLALLLAPDVYWFSPDEVELGRTIANQVAVALQNARLFAESERLFAETQRRSAELAALFDLGVSLTQVRDEQRLLDLTFDQLVKLMSPDAVLVSLLKTENQMAVNILEDGQRQPAFNVERKGGSFSEHVIATNQPLLIRDTAAGETPVGGVRVGERSCACWLGVPLVVRGAAIGVLSVQSYTPRRFNETDLRLVEQVANQLSVAIDNAELFVEKEQTAVILEQRVEERTEQLAREHHRIQTLLAITTELAASLDLDMVLNRTLSVINDTIGAEHGSILLIQPDSPFLLLRASSGYMGSVGKGGKVSVNRRDEGLAGWVIATRHAVLVDDVWADPRWKPRDDGTRQHRSALAIPLLVSEDILGVLMLYNRESRSFMTDQLDLMQATAKQIAVAINNAQLYGLIRDQAERLGDMLRTQHIETSRSQAILEAVADGVLVTDTHRLVTVFNPSAEKIFGLKRADVLGRSLSHFSGLFGAAGQVWFETIQAWSDRPNMAVPGEGFARQITMDNNRVIEVMLAPVRLRSDFLGTVSVVRDITDQVEVDRMKSEFVATVSHELRTPMTAIKGYVEILLMGAAGKLSEDQTRFLHVVQQNTKRLNILVDDLLDVSRIDAGKVELAFKPLEMGELVSEAFALFSQSLDESQRGLVTFRSEIPPEGLPPAAGDRQRVLQILDVLFSNAFTFTEPGGSVTVRAHPEGGMMQVDVADTGIGIKPEETGRIFERFYRGSNPLVYAVPGNGLGLSIAKTLVEMHKGKIWFESAGIPGQGSVFSFTLPLYE